MKNLPPYFLGFSEEEAEETYKLFENILNRLSNSYAITTGIEKEDLFGEALVGLSIAVKNRDYKKSIKEFRAYAVKTIMSHLNNYIADMKTIVHVPTYILKANSYIVKLKLLLGVEDIFSIFLTKPKGEKEEEYSKLIGYIINAAERAGVTIEELIKRSEYLPVHDTSYKEQHKQEEHSTDKLAVAEMKKHMTDEELIITDGIMKDKTFSEIGKDLNISGSAVHQKFTKLKKKMMEKINNEHK